MERYSWRLELVAQVSMFAHTNKLPSLTDLKESRRSKENHSAYTAARKHHESLLWISEYARPPPPPSPGNMQIPWETKEESTVDPKGIQF